MNKLNRGVRLLAILSALTLLFTLVACNGASDSNVTSIKGTTVSTTTSPTHTTTIKPDGTAEPSLTTTAPTTEAPETDETPQTPSVDTSIEIADLSHELFNGTDAYMVVNGGVPFFTEDEITTNSFETYAELDELGRCGTTFACVGRDLMPTDARESISSVYPSGWKYNGKSNNNKYDFVDGQYIYNRCHLIGFQLTGENANEKNLITGTRYLNIDGMLDFENMIADAVKEDDLHVMYRVTPIFKGDNLVPEGLLLEGYSVEDEGATIEFCFFSFNVQPGVEINYATGENWLSDNPPATEIPEEPETENTTTYILNTNSQKFHIPGCASAEKISEQNKQEKTCTRDELMADGYSPCGVCKP